MALNKKTTLTIILSVMLLTSLTTGFKAVKLASADTSSSSPATWNELFGGLSNYIVSSLVNTSDGGYAIAGSVNSTAAFLIKTDSNGSVQWSKTYEGLGSVHIYSMVQTSDGGYILAGGTASNATTDSSDWYFWLVKTDSSGNQEWSKTYNDSGGAGASAIVQTNNGGYTLAGYIGGFGPMWIWVVNVDSNGTMLWNTTWPGNPQPMASNCLIQTNDGGCVVTGYASSLNGFNGLQSYIFIFKLASDGNLRWQMTYSTLADRNSALYAVQTKDDSYVLAGTMLSNTTGLETIWFATVNSTGSVTAPLTNQTLQLRSAQPLPTATGLLGQSTKSQSTGMQSWYLGIIVAVLAIVIILAVVLAIKNKNHSHQPLAGN